MEHCRSPDGVTSISVRPYYTMLSRVYLALAMGFLVIHSVLEQSCSDDRKSVWPADNPAQAVRVFPKTFYGNLPNLHV